MPFENRESVNRYPPRSEFVIRFDFSDEAPVLWKGEYVLFAGEYHGGLGWAHTTETAIKWTDPKTAARVLANGYGGLAKYGEVVQVETAPEGAAQTDN